MAPQNDVAPLLPDTLPEDFSDWDSEAAPAPSLGNTGEWEAWIAAHSPGETPKPLGQSAGRDAISPPAADASHVSGSASLPPASVERQKDFSDWDSEASPAFAPVNRSEWEAWEAAHSFGKPQKPHDQSASRDAISPPLANKPRISGSASPAPAPLKPQKSPSELAGISPSRASLAPDASHKADQNSVAPSLPPAAAADGTGNSRETAASLSTKADEGLFQSFHSSFGDIAEQKTARKKWMIIAPVSAGSILLLLVFAAPLFHHGTRPAEKPPVQAPPEATDSQQDTDTPAPPDLTLPTQDTPPATAEKQQATENHPAKAAEAAKPTQVQAEMMNDQLTAPTQIPQGSKRQAADDAPPSTSLSTAGADGLGGNGAIGSVFNGQEKPVVKPSKPITISAGVATGLLIQETPPIYPPAAKAVRVSGTVELEVTISKIGTIKDLHVVSGPVMLRQAAADAVRTWRYKPYTLNHEPIEVQSTISVVFSLGG